MSGGFHLRRRLRERWDDVADVMEALATFVEPVGVDTRAVERLDQLILGGAVVEGEAERPFGRMPAVLASLTLWSENPSAPWPGGSARRTGVPRLRDR